MKLTTTLFRLAVTACCATTATVFALGGPTHAQTAQSPFSNTVEFSSFDLALFEDVATSHWAKSFIDGLLDQDILEGFPDGDFRPDDELTWGQFAAMMTQAFGDPTPVRDLDGFPSLNTEHWAYEDLQSLYRMGFDFPAINPDQTLTRLEILSMLVERFEFEPVGEPDLVDVFRDGSAIPAEQRELMVAAMANGLLVNYPDVRTLSVTNVATRAEMAVMLYQTMVKLDRVSPIASPYLVDIGAVERTNTTNNSSETDEAPRQNCNQGIGNGSEGCDPGNSQPHGGSNDE
jgi:predicted CoA-binding protein